MGVGLLWFWDRKLTFVVSELCSYEMSSSNSVVLPAPLLSSIHSGVPERLVAESDRAKRLLYSNKTLPTSVPRRRGVPLPPDVSQTAFDTAIAELRQTLGDSNIELNDKPLVDGWYLEHPYALSNSIHGHLKLIRLQQYP